MQYADDHKVTMSTSGRKLPVTKGCNRPTAVIHDLPLLKLSPPLYIRRYSFPFKIQNGPSATPRTIGKLFMDRDKSLPARDWVLRNAEPGRIERIEAWFGGHGYDPHRHDTYSIGRTMSGVQSFHYKGSMRHGIPGNTLVLHPDELHDGMAGTEAGFRYRMAYVDPALIQQVLGGESLPYVPGGLSDDLRLYNASQPFVQAMDHPLDSL